MIEDLGFIMKGILLVAALVELVGCTSYQPDHARLFQKSAECEKYANAMLTEYRETARFMPTFPERGDWYVERVFYSPKRDSCLCVLGASLPSKDETTYDIFLIDSLTRKLLWSRGFKGNQATTMADDIEAVVKSYE